MKGPDSHQPSRGGHHGDYGCRPGKRGGAPRLLLEFSAIRPRLRPSRMGLGKLQDVTKIRGGKIHDENR
jgi:hypothetical protein